MLLQAYTEPKKNDEVEFFCHAKVSWRHWWARAYIISLNIYVLPHQPTWNKNTRILEPKLTSTKICTLMLDPWWLFCCITTWKDKIFILLFIFWGKPKHFCLILPSWTKDPRRFSISRSAFGKKETQAFLHDTIFLNKGSEKIFHLPV